MDPTNLLQFLLTGVTVGLTYALIALSFTLIYNVSHVVNFSQGEFVMLGAMSAIYMVSTGLPLYIAVPLAVVITSIIGILFERIIIERARGADVVTVIIITIGASIFFRGLALLIWGKNIHGLKHFSGEEPINLLGVTIIPQYIWVIVTTFLVVLLLSYFFSRTLFGKAILACSFNERAARLVGIDISLMLLVSYGISAGMGATAGVLIAPISFMAYDSGTMLGLKGFCAAILGGMGNSLGSVVGGLILGILESITAGLLSSAYKDAVSFIIILLILFFKPQGLLGHGASERV